MRSLLTKRHAVLVVTLLGACTPDDEARDNLATESSSLVASAPIGTLPGSLEVSRTGNATYSVPIDVPPGKEGLTPALSLAYDSRSGNGQVGVGWSLRGLSKITRCSSSVAYGGRTGGISFSNLDRLCLDGEPLFVSKGTYGAGDAEYQTAVDRQARIVTNGVFSEGTPKSFTVYYRDGRIGRFRARHEIGRVSSTTLDGTLVVSPKASVFAWAQDIVEDRSGNMMTIEWGSDHDPYLGGGQYPVAMRYTYGPGGPTGSSTRLVRFEYEARPDRIEGYVAGFHHHTTSRLASIDTFTLNDGKYELVHRYQLGYRADSITRRSVLESIEKCDGASTCIPATRLFTTKGNYSHEPPMIVAAIDGDSPRMRAADVDGDGRDDVMWRDLTHPSWKLQLRTDAGFAAPIEIHPFAGIKGMGDFDLDGDVDLILSDSSWGEPGDVAVYRWNAGSFIEVQHLGAITAYGAVPKIADIDGDGAPDLIYRVEHPGSSGVWKWRRNTRVADEPFGAEQHTGFAEPHGATDSIGVVARILGDGASQLVYEAGDRFRFLFDAASWIDSGWLNESPLSTWWPHFLDINGDGLDDLLDLGNGRLRINTGWGFGPAYDLLGPDVEWRQPKQTVSQQQWTPEVDSGFRFLDLNNDGRTDFVRADTGGGPGVRCISDGRWMQCEDYLEVQPDFDPDYPGYPYDFLDIDGDGVKDLVQIKGGVVQVSRRTAAIPDRIETVRNGLDAMDIVTYATTTNPAVYTPGPACTYPQRCNPRRISVVARIERSNGTGLNREVYEYADARFDLRGEGFLGFAQTRRSDDALARTIEHRYSVDRDLDGRYVGLGQPIRSTTFQRIRANHVRVSTTAFVNSGWAQVNGASFRRPVSEITEELEWTNFGGILVPGMDQPLHAVASGVTPFRTTTVARSYDPYANLLSERRQVDGGSLSERTVEYEIRTDTWLVGLPTRVVETSTVEGKTDSREIVHAYDEKGRLMLRTVEPTRGHLTRHTQYVRAFDGLVERIEEWGTDAPVRATELFYGPARVFLTKIRNALGHTTEYSTHPGIGAVESVRDLNGAETTFVYDTFGRLRRRMDPDGRISTSSLSLGGTPEVAFRLVEQENTGASFETDFDVLGRPTRIARQLEAGWTEVNVRYDVVGRIHQRSLRHHVGAPVSWVTHSYDQMGRTVQVDYPDGSARRARFTPLKTEHWDQADHYSFTELNVDGQLSRSSSHVDGRDLVTRYAYGPFGRLARVTDSNGKVVDEIEHDSLGRRVKSQNADAGKASYHHNAFGELVKEVDALERGTVYHRDALGRIVAIEDVDGGLTQLRWDTSPGPLGTPVLGALAEARSPDDIVTTFEYDALGRRVRKTLEVDSTTLTIQNRFDAVGRPSGITYPSTPASSLDVSYTYGTDGLLETARSGATIWWESLARDADMRVVRERVGSGAFVARTYEPETLRLSRIESYRMVPVGEKALARQTFQDLRYTYFANGYMSSRADVVEGRNETFGYDGANRLTTWSMADADSSGVYQYTYDDIGNLIYADDLEGVHTFGHGGDAGPHAVTSIDGEIIEYDALGRRTSSPMASVSYTPFDLPRRVTTESGETVFRYDALRARAFKDSKDVTTTYLDGLYELRKAPEGTTHHFFIQAGGRTIAEVVQKSTGATSVRYLHPDHLGSANVLTDPTGAILERRAYTPFGDKLGEPVASVSSHTGGFTGHEGDWAEGLVNMRGRIYDPTTRSFLSPDPHVTRPALGQSFNRYAYVLNAPLSFVDPTGFDGEWDVTDYDEGSSGNCGDCDFPGGTGIHQEGPDDHGGSPGPGFTYTEYGDGGSSGDGLGYDDGYGGSWSDGYGEQGYDDYGYSDGSSALDYTPVMQSGPADVRNPHWNAPHFGNVPTLEEADLMTSREDLHVSGTFPPMGGISFFTAGTYFLEYPDGHQIPMGPTSTGTLAYTVQGCSVGGTGGCGSLSAQLNTESGFSIGYSYGPAVGFAGELSGGWSVSSGTDGQSVVTELSPGLPISASFSIPNGTTGQYGAGVSAGFGVSLVTVSNQQSGTLWDPDLF